MKQKQIFKNLSLTTKIIGGGALIAGLIFLEIFLVSHFREKCFLDVFLNIEPLAIFFSAMAFWIIYLTLDEQNKINLEDKKSKYLKSQEEKFLFIIHNLKENHSTTKGTFKKNANEEKTYYGNQYYQWLWIQLRELHYLLKLGNFPSGMHYYRSILYSYIQDRNNLQDFIDKYNDCEFCHFARQLITFMSVKRGPEINIGIRTFNSLINFLDKEYTSLKTNSSLKFEDDEVENIFNSYLDILKIIVNDEALMVFLYFNIYYDEKFSKYSPISSLIYSKFPADSFIDKKDYEILYNNSR